MSGDHGRLRIAWPALLSGTLALLLYTRTLAPGLTWAHDGGDGGDLLAAALTRGVPHPTGYPTYQLLLRVALGLAEGGEPARVGNWLSALCAAAAVALLADLARRTLAGSAWRDLAALGAGLIWAASPALWSQAVITEVYALNALAVVAILWLLWRWCSALATGHPGWPWLSVMGLVLGLGVGNHLTLTLVLPGIAAGCWPQRRALRQDLWKTCALPLAACAFGMSVYATLPWAASHAPAINWGGATTLQGLWWLVSGVAYRGLVLGVPWAYLPGRLAAWGAEAGRQLGGGPWGMLIALLGLWQMDRVSRAWSQATVLVAAAYTIFAVSYNAADSYVYLIPAWGVASLWFAQGASWIGDRIAEQGSGRWTIAVVIVLSAGLPLAAVMRHWPQMDLSRDHEAQSFIDDVVATAAPQAVILLGEDSPTFALWYARYGLGQRPDLAPVNVHLYDFPWYWSSLLRQHPALAELAHDGQQPALDEFVLEASRRWPLYRAGSLGRTVMTFREEALGALIRLSPQ